MDLVRGIERDRKSGATALAGKALEALARSRAAGPELLRVRPAMPLIAAVVRLALRKGVGEARKELRRRQALLLARAEEYLPAGSRYMAYGESGTVGAVLKALQAQVVDRPPVVVGLVGADAIYPDGDFVNARGTADFLRRVRRAGAGVFAVATELKAVKGEVPVERGFERVPGRLVHAILTEKGLRYPPTGTPAGVEPTWLDRGALDPHGGLGRCHPHHPRKC